MMIQNFQNRHIQKAGIILGAAIGAVGLLSCNQSGKDNPPVAQVGEHILYLDELEASIPNYLEEADSTLWADDYIKKWVKHQLLILKAEENLSSEQKDVSKELEEYRNSLITYRYKKELMQQKMDTIISDAEIQKYYDANHDNFILSQNIVKAIFIKVPVEVASPETIKNLCANDEPQFRSQLNEYCLSYAKSYDRFNDEWVSAELVLRNIPEETSNSESFIRRNKFIESTAPDYYYIVCIRDYRFAGEVAPIDYVRNDIRSLLLNKRKIQFLKNMENDLYKEGLDNNRIKFFTIKKS
jgi:hypothetical protein